MREIEKQKEGKEISIWRNTWHHKPVRVRQAPTSSIIIIVVILFNDEEEQCCPLFPPPENRENEESWLLPSLSFFSSIGLEAEPQPLWPHTSSLDKCQTFPSMDLSWDKSARTIRIRRTHWYRSPAAKVCWHHHSISIIQSATGLTRSNNPHYFRDYKAIRSQISNKFSHVHSWRVDLHIKSINFLNHIKKYAPQEAYRSRVFVFIHGEFEWNCCRVNKNRCSIIHNDHPTPRNSCKEDTINKFRK